MTPPGNQYSVDVVTTHTPITVFVNGALVNVNITGTSPNWKITVAAGDVACDGSNPGTIDIQDAHGNLLHREQVAPCP